MLNTFVKLTVECFNCPFFISVPAAPEITSLMNQSSSEVLVTWNITLPMTNGPGAITLYTIYVDSNEGVNTADGTVLTYVIRNLVPYQLVTVQVSASTSAGEGARSAAETGRSSEARKWQFRETGACCFQGSVCTSVLLIITLRCVCGSGVKQLILSVCPSVCLSVLPKIRISLH